MVLPMQAPLPLFRVGLEIAKQQKRQRDQFELFRKTRYRFIVLTRPALLFHSRLAFPVQSPESRSTITSC